MMLSISFSHQCLTFKTLNSGIIPNRSKCSFFIVQTLLSFSLTRSMSMFRSLEVTKLYVFFLIVVHFFLCVQEKPGKTTSGQFYWNTAMPLLLWQSWVVEDNTKMVCKVSNVTIWTFAEKKIANHYSNQTPKLRSSFLSSSLLKSRLLIFSPTGLFFPLLSQ